MAWTKLKKAVVVGTTLIVGIGTIGLALKSASSRTSRSGRLLDGSRVTLASVTYGKTHVSPTSKAPIPLRFLPAQWSQRFKWDPGVVATANCETDILIFWLHFKNSEGDRSVRYAIADENGFESPALFSGPNWIYKPAGFGTNKVGDARSFGLLPRRSKIFYLCLYQQNKRGQSVRVANFSIENIPLRNVPIWTASSLPVSQQTNGLVFTLENAVVGILPKEKLLPPHDLLIGQWSEFRFRVTDRGQPTTGWNINEIWISDATGNQARTSREDRWSLNGKFSRIQDDQIVCTHRWEFWPGEPAWKLRVHFEHTTRTDFWAEYFIQPNFLRGAK